MELDRVAGDGRLHVSFLDVGRATPRSSVCRAAPRCWWIRAGSPASTFDIGDRVVAPVLRNAGVRRLDYLVLTHGDPDHIGGANAIVEEFRPRHVWEGIPVPRFEPLSVLKAAALDRRLIWTNVLSGDRLRLDEVDVSVLHPPPADWERQRVRNDDSIVLELRWRDVSFVFTGDVGSAVERTLRHRVAPAPLRVLKVPHRGSLTSRTPEFVRALGPHVAVFSGDAQTRGHPRQPYWNYQETRFSNFGRIATAIGSETAATRSIRRRPSRGTRRSSSEGRHGS
jgi:competence protein ComEC